MFIYCKQSKTEGNQELYFNSKAKLPKSQLVKKQLLIKKQKRSIEATVEAKKLSTKKGILIVMKNF